MLGSWWWLGLAESACTCMCQLSHFFVLLDTKHSQRLPPESFLAWEEQAGILIVRVTPWEIGMCWKPLGCGDEAILVQHCFSLLPVCCGGLLVGLRPGAEKGRT